MSAIPFPKEKVDAVSADFYLLLARRARHESHADDVVCALPALGLIFCMSMGGVSLTMYW